MMGLSERRLRVRATYVNNLLHRGRLSASDPKFQELQEECESLLAYLDLIKEPIDKSTLKQVV